MPRCNVSYLNCTDALPSIWRRSVSRRTSLGNYFGKGMWRFLSWLGTRVRNDVTLTSFAILGMVLPFIGPIVESPKIIWHPCRVVCRVRDSRGALVRRDPARDDVTSRVFGDPVRRLRSRKRLSPQLGQSSCEQISNVAHSRVLRRSQSSSVKIAGSHPSRS